MNSLKLLGILVMIVVADIVVIGIYLTVKTPENTSPSSPTSYDVLSPLPPSNLTMGVYSKAAVVSLGGPCSEIGREMLEAGGSAVDAAIATLLCDGVCVMQSMGVGGGFLMTFYNRTEGKTYSLVARETAPAAASRDMYTNHSDWSKLGPISAGVPGELKGYQEAHKRFGRLPWRDLFQPTIKLCEEGVPINKKLADTFVAQESYINQYPTFREIVLNSTGGRFPKEGELLRLPHLARTLRVIADSSNMADELYKGSLTKQFVEDMKEGGGIITEQDMNDYSVRWEEPYNASLSGGLTVFSAPLPGSGILATFILRLLDGLYQYAFSDNQRSHLVIEAFKHAYGHRTDLGDPYFVNKTKIDETVRQLTDEQSILSIRDKIKPGWTTDDVSYYGAHYSTEDHGTDHVVVLAPDGSAASVTSSVNLYFGSKFVSRSTGIILNNQMDDFSTPGQVNYFGVSPSETNYIAPGKRPLSSMSPTVVVDSQGDVRLIIGAAGGSMITTQTALVTIRNIWEGHNIKEAMDQARFHHQLLPMNVSYEYGILQDMVDSWHSAGHKTVRIGRSNYMAVVSAIARLGDNITASADFRRPGSVAGF